MKQKTTLDLPAAVREHAQCIAKTYALVGSNAAFMQHQHAGNQVIDEYAETAMRAAAVLQGLLIGVIGEPAAKRMCDDAVNALVEATR